MNRPSVKHHYLPRHYLRGFTDDTDGFYIYDKQEDNVFRSSPNSTFFENNLNTIESPTGTPSDWLEDYYTTVENRVWGSFDRIRNSTSKTKLDPWDKMYLFLFLLFLHWRLPSNIEYAAKLSEEAFSEDNDLLNYFALRNTNGDEVPNPITETIKSSSGFKKSMRVLVAFAPFLKDKDWEKTLANWRFLYSGDDKGWNIVGDNPIITEGRYDHDPINCLKEFVFPVSGRILLVNTQKPINKGFPSEIVIYSSNAIFERARRFVACQNKDLLEVLVEQYKLYIRFGKTKSIIPELFQIFQT